MKRQITAALFLLFMAGTASASHYDQRLGSWVTHRQWVDFYVETAMRQVRAARRAHCGLKGGHWSPDYRVHLDWAYDVSRHKGWVVIDRRDAALRKCSAHADGRWDGHRLESRHRSHRRDWGDYRRWSHWRDKGHHHHRHDGRHRDWHGEHDQDHRWRRGG